MKKWLSMIASGVFLFQTVAAFAAPHIHVLILDGESAASYHNWKAVTPILKAELDETGLFDTDVITAPPAVTLRHLAELLERNRIKRVPIVQDGKIVGIVSRANLLHALASLAPTVPATATSDETIRTDLLAELERQKWAPVGFLNVIVCNGVVDLWGTIPDERERQALIVAAQNTPGVKNVQDHLVWVEPTSGVVIGAKGEVVAA